MGFVYVGLRVRTRKFWIAMVIGCAVSAALWIFTPDSDPNTEGEQVSDLGAGLIFFGWVGLILYGAIINRAYLRWRATRTEAHAWYNQSSSSAASPGTPFAAHSTSAAPQASVLGVDTGQYLAAPPSTTAPVDTSSPSAAVAPHRAATAVPVDVNGCSADELTLAAGGDSALAAHIIAVRDERGGFRDLNDLIAAVGLQPHEMVKIRGRVHFGPPPASPGNIQDQRKHPTAPPNQPGGRILDF
ncbi:ComEA family DNA-binding protein [Isoptericola sp. NPDC056618]|uniref:ComEA family DNA-binding protein n=1 Tax=Isoptericola sp. NPDC056618 TaxID=3345878 RepID=UPI0036CD0DC0